MGEHDDSNYLTGGYEVTYDQYGMFMTIEQLEWCQTLTGNCIQCKFQEECEMCKLRKGDKK